MTTAHSGDQWPSELTISQDPVSGATVREEIAFDYDNVQKRTNHDLQNFSSDVCVLFRS